MALFLSFVLVLSAPVFLCMIKGEEASPTVNIANIILIDLIQHTLPSSSDICLHRSLQEITTSEATERDRPDCSCSEIATSAAHAASVAIAIAQPASCPQQCPLYIPHQNKN